MANILVAKTEKEVLIFLHEHYGREALVNLRNMHTFYCPECSGLVLLKIGDIKIPHFAHKSRSVCGSNESESLLHLQGKLLLYRFFKDKNFSVEIEKYLPDIRQRADLLIDRHTAIEFQCSPISASDITKRSTAYSSLGLNFIWIAGSKEKNEKRIQVIRLMEYQKEMLLFHNQSNYLILLNPETKTFFYFSNLFYINGSRWIGKVGTLPVEKQSFPLAIPKILQKHEFETVCNLFGNARSRYIQSQYFVKKKFQSPFWLLCYNLQLDVRNIPAIIGVPILGAECFAEHPVIWQLKMFQAYKKEKSIKAILSSNEIKLQNKYNAKQAALVLGCYEDFLIRYLAAEGNDVQQSSILYDIYCNNVRKLRR